MLSKDKEHFDPLDLVLSASNPSLNKEYWCDAIKSFPFRIVQIAPMRQISWFCAIASTMQNNTKRADAKTKQNSWLNVNDYI